MKERHRFRYQPIVAVLGSLTLLFSLTPAQAKKFDVEMDTSGTSATAVEQPAPEFPDGKMRGGQEGWVRMSFIIDRDGRAADPVVVDSSGGALFEQAALEIVSSWRFEAPDSTTESANNTVDIRFEISGGRDRATRSFLRRYRDIASDLYYVKPESAREKVDMANEFGGWNLYESTMLSLLNARVEAAEGDVAHELEYYRRALAIGGQTALGSKERTEILGRIFVLEFDANQYGAAMATLKQLQAEKGNGKKVAELADKIRQLESAVEGDATLATAGAIHSPSDSDAGMPLWAYTPVRRDFSFAEVSGNVERFEARCDNNRLSAQVTTGTRWSLPADWGSCRIFVFGDEAATFNFVEHREGPGDEEVGDNALASSHDVD